MDQETPTDIYDPNHVAEIFDRCSSAYRRWSAVASFGMVWLWRKVCVESLPATTNAEGHFVDLMAGTGEVWPHLIKRFPSLASIKAIDNSKRMHKEAIERLHSSMTHQCRHLHANVLETDLPHNSADGVVSTFGLKTFNHQQQIAIAKQVNAVLKPGGTFSFIEASDPIGWRLRPLYRFYMDRCLPLIEKLVLHGAQDFSTIGTYTKNFVNCDKFEQALLKEGLEVRSFSHFFGCATGVYGQKPSS